MRDSCGICVRSGLTRISKTSTSCCTFSKQQCNKSHSLLDEDSWSDLVARLSSSLVRCSWTVIEYSRSSNVATNSLLLRLSLWRNQSI